MSLRKAKLAETRDKLIAVSVDLFLTRGFHATLVEDIVTAANVSRRTFFNYFPSKQDVLTEWFQLQTSHLAQCLTSRPQGEGPWVSLDACYHSMSVAFGQDSPLALKTRQLLAAEPALLALKYQCLIATAQELALTLEARITDPLDRTLIAHTYVQGAIAAYTSACSIWEVSSDNPPFESILRQAFDMAKPAIASKSRRGPQHK